MFGNGQIGFLIWSKEKTQKLSFSFKKPKEDIPPHAGLKNVSIVKTKILLILG